MADTVKEGSLPPDIRKILRLHQLSGTLPFDLTIEKKLRPNFKLILYCVLLVSATIFYFTFLTITSGLLDFENKPLKNVVSQLSLVFETVVFLSRFLNLVTCWGSIINNTSNYHGVDESLFEIGFNNVNMSGENPLKKLWISFHVLFTFLAVDLIVDFVILDNNKFYLQFWLYLVFVLSYNRVMLFLTIGLIYDLRSRFHTINSILLNAGSVHTSEDYKTVNIFTNPLNCTPKFLMKTLKKARAFCVEFSTIHNRNLSLYILCYLATNILSIIVHLYLLIIVLRKSQNKLQVIYPLAWCLLKGISLLRLIQCHCETQKEANRTSMVVHRLLKYGDISEISNELQQFSLELLHNKFRYSVYGMFDIDYTLITSVTGVVCTYLIILYQLLGSRTSSSQMLTPVLNISDEVPLA